MKNRIFISALLLLLIVLIGTACSREGNSSPSSTKPDQQTQSQTTNEIPKKEKWIHGVQSFKGDSGFQLIGLKQGFYEELGIDFEILEFESDSTMLKALIAGEIDSMATTPSGALVAVSQGQDIRFVGSTISGLSHILYTKNEIKSVDDLKGKAIGISGPGALPQVLTQALLIKAGISDEEVTWVNAGGSSARVKALIAGKVDASISSVDFIPLVDEDPNIHYVTDLGEELPDYIRVVFMVTGKTADNNEELLMKVLEAEAKGLRYSIENRDEVLVLTSETIDKDINDPTIALVYDTHINNKLLNPNLIFEPAALTWMYELGKQTGNINNDVDLSKNINLQFAEEIINKIGEYSW